MPGIELRANSKLCGAVGLGNEDLRRFGKRLTGPVADVLSTSTVKLDPAEVSIVKHDVFAGQDHDHLWIVITTGPNPERVANLEERKKEIEKRIIDSHLLPRGTRFLVWILPPQNQVWSDPPVTVP